tara:strand:+ start:1124 stop:1426 length:303 start_codon:yes stop_codon:yes gene_type:complete
MGKKNKVKYVNIDLKMKGLSNNELMVFSHIKSLCKGVKPYCFASSNSLAETLNVSERTLYRILNDLEDKRLIKRETKASGRGHGKFRTIRVLTTAKTADI